MSLFHFKNIFFSIQFLHFLYLLPRFLSPDSSLIPWPNFLTPWTKFWPLSLKCWMNFSLKVYSRIVSFKKGFSTDVSGYVTSWEALRLLYSRHLAPAHFFFSPRFKMRSVFGYCCHLLSSCEQRAVRKHSKSAILPCHYVITKIYG